MGRDDGIEGRMRLEPLYGVRSTHPDSWAVELESGWQQHLFFDREKPGQ